MRLALSFLSVVLGVVLAVWIVRTLAAGEEAPAPPRDYIAEQTQAWAQLEAAIRVCRIPEMKAIRLRSELAQRLGGPVGRPSELRRLTGEWVDLLEGFSAEFCARYG